MHRSLLSIALLLLHSVSLAGEADVLAAEVEHLGDNFYRFTVTVQHSDENWQHFAKAWEIIDRTEKYWVPEFCDTRMSKNNRLPVAIRWPSRKVLNR